MNGVNMGNDLVLTKEGLEKLKKELEEFKKVRRPKVIARIKTAKEFGDLSENAEYEEAKNEQSFIEGRIQELESMIKKAHVAETYTGGGIVNIGSKIDVKCDGEKTSYEIVGATESDPASGKISSESPIGQALLGRKKGEKVTVPIPDGTMECEILKIQQL